MTSGGKRLGAGRPTRSTQWIRLQIQLSPEIADELLRMARLKKKTPAQMITKLVQGARE